jgi:hypothetical protein
MSPERSCHLSTEGSSTPDRSPSPGWWRRPRAPELVRGGLPSGSQAPPLAATAPGRGSRFPGQEILDFPPAVVGFLVLS